MVSFVKHDLEFILAQIKIAEESAMKLDENGVLVEGRPLSELISNPLLPHGLRTVDGRDNNIIDGREEWGAADTLFPRLLEPGYTQGSGTFDTNGPTIPNGVVTNNNYGQTGNVVDSEPRTISNLIVDQTLNNPAAIIAALKFAEITGGEAQTALTEIQAKFAIFEGLIPSIGTTKEAYQLLSDTVDAVKTGAPTGLVPSGVLNLAEALIDHEIDITDNGSLVIPNVAPDEGISAPFNSWMTLFGQFFDHGLDLVTKGDNGTIYIPLAEDDPLYNPASPQTNFMVLTRATPFAGPGADGQLGTADDTIEHQNTTTSFIDQNQTYTSHPSHQVFLREYELDASGRPVATGRLLENEGGGLATWKDVKDQARELLGIELTDADVGRVPLLLTDAYGNFIPGPGGFPQVITNIGPDLIPNTLDDETTSGTPDAPVNLAAVSAIRTAHAFLDDIAHNAAPFQNGVLLAQDVDTDTGNAIATNPQTGQRLAYDNELLDVHKIAGDGRANENIGLTAVHHVFHSEHNRLVEHTKDVVLQTGDLAFINEWLTTDIVASAIPVHPGEDATPDELATYTTAVNALDWDGERLFQAARFGTEMQYQHLVFEEFARKVNPAVDLFVFNPTMDIDPSIVAEFAHVVYRFGHSMLSENIELLGADGQNPTEIGLIDAFLNPVAYNHGGSLDPNALPVDSDEAAAAIIRGMTRQRGNEIDEFVVDALRNNLLGLPLDLAAINMTRARDTGIPSFNDARAQFYEMTQNEWLKPYESWVDFAQHLKNPASIINFVAAYGTHASITGATTFEAKRAAATDLVLGGGDAPADRLDFLNASGAYAGGTLGGLNNVDLWIGGLAESILPFGGMLGSTFTFIFEAQMENLQNGDRLYYLSRTQGLHFLTELEANSFASLVKLNTDIGDGGAHIPGDLFSNMDFILEVNRDVQDDFDPLNDSPSGIDPSHDDPVLNALEPKVARDLHRTVDGVTYENSLKFTGGEHVVLGGTAGNDVLIADLGDDTLWGDGGDDLLIGGHGINRLHGGAGDDIIFDGGDPSFIHGEDGNDAISAGSGLGELVFAGDGHDFVLAGIDGKEVFASAGNDFILGTPDMDFLLGGEGDDWIEGGEGFDTIAGENSELFFNSTVIGHDVMFAGTNEQDFDAESGDDIMVQGESVMRNEGMLGFDWVSFKDMDLAADGDMRIKIFTTVEADILRNRFDRVEAMSGWKHNDKLTGDDRVFGAVDPLEGALLAENIFEGDELTREGVARITGLDTLVQSYLDAQPNQAGTAVVYNHGNILLGGDGSDVITGGGGDDIIDGDKWLNVRIGILDSGGNEIGTTDYMQGAVHFYSATEAAALGQGYAAASPLLLAQQGAHLDTLVFSRAVNPGNLKIIREILDSSDDPTGSSVSGNAGDFDTAVFRGNIIEYTVRDANGDIIDITQPLTTNITGTITVEHTLGDADGGGLTHDGIDTLSGIERLQFADGSVQLVSGLNDAPVGTPALRALQDSDGAPIFQAGMPIRIATNADGSLFGVTDPDNVTAAGAITAFTVTWQIEDGAGSDIFVDALATGISFTPSADPVVGIDGERVRALISYTDANGVLEVVTTAPSSPLAPASNLIATDGDDVLAGTHAIPNILANQGFGVALPQAGNDGTLAAPIDGGLGDDEIHGLSGNDVLSGGAGGDGNEILDGGSGTDTALFFGNVGNYTFERTDEGTIEVIDNVFLEEDEVISIENFRFFDGTTTTIFTLAQVEAFADGLALPPNLNATAGDDVLVDIVGRAATIDGLAGNDEIFGLDLADTLIGGLGDDLLDGGAGADILIGGAGSDILDGGVGPLNSNGQDVVIDTAVFVGTIGDGVGSGDFSLIFAPDGNLEVVNAAGTEEDLLLNIELLDFTDLNLTLAQAQDLAGIVRGTGAGETLNGGPGAADDVIFGLGGADTINGLAGDDVLVGGGGTDTLNGGADRDGLSGGAGNDAVNGGADDDSIFWSAGDGRDTIDGGAGTDTLEITGEAATAEIFRIFTRQAAIDANLTPGAGTEIVVTRSIGGAAATNADRIALVDNVEEIVINGRPLSPGTLVELGDTIEVIGDFTGTSLALNTITINGTGGNDTVDISGLTSDHRVVFLANGGEDTIIGDERPQDVIDLSEGGTVVRDTGGEDPDEDPDEDEDEDEDEDGDDDTDGDTDGDDDEDEDDDDDSDGDTDADGLTIAVGSGATDKVDSINGTANADEMHTGAGADIVTAGAGNDVVHGEAGADQLFGGDGNDELFGGDGADTLLGNAGADVLIGGAGADEIDGGAGADVINGGAGNDILTGGDGNDEFIFEAGFRTDTIADFELAQDLIDLTAFEIAMSDLTVTQSGADTVVTASGVDGFGRIILQGVDADAVNDQDFLFQ